MSKKFLAIEGLRGWLAWVVVVDHVVHFSTPFLSRLVLGAGFQAVLVFVIVSGFVITHLLVVKPEPYRAYIVRRFFRIWPLFAVTCIGGYFASFVQLQLPLGNQELADTLQAIAVSQETYFWRHLAAHAVMLHGLLSNAVLPHSAYAFNMPAWSISLEWQFYLVAPFALLLRRSALPWLAVLMLIGALLFSRGSLGSFDQPAHLLAVSGFFAVGMISRLAYPKLVGRVHNLPVALAGVVALPIFVKPALAIWALVYLGLVLPLPGYRTLFEGRLPTYFGSRSYSIYLAHLLVIVAVQWFWLTLFAAPPNFLALLVATVPATMVTAEVLYRFVERPGIRLGAYLATQFERTRLQERAMDCERNQINERA